MLLKPFPHRVSVAAIVQERDRLVAVSAHGDQVLHTVDAAVDVVNLDAGFGSRADATAMPVAFEHGFEQSAEFRLTSTPNAVNGGECAVAFAIDTSLNTRFPAERAGTGIAPSLAELFLILTERQQVSVAETDRVQRERTSALSTHIKVRPFSVASFCASPGTVETHGAGRVSLVERASALATTLSAVDRLYNTMARNAKCVGSLLHAAVDVVSRVDGLDFLGIGRASARLGGSHRSTPSVTRASGGASRAEAFCLSNYTVNPGDLAL